LRSASAASRCNCFICACKSNLNNALISEQQQQQQQQQATSNKQQTCVDLSLLEPHPTLRQMSVPTYRPRVVCKQTTNVRIAEMNDRENR
jgi:hypothetical protein